MSSASPIIRHSLTTVVYRPGLGAARGRYTLQRIILMQRSLRLTSRLFSNGGYRPSLFFTLLSDPVKFIFSRALPKNLKFFQMDVCQPLPFEDESFDVVHARFVLMHVSCKFRCVPMRFDFLTPRSGPVAPFPRHLSPCLRFDQTRRTPDRGRD